MKIFNLKYLFLIFFSFFYSLAFSNNLQFDGMSKLTIDDIQSLTTADIFDNEINDVELDTIVRDLYLSDLIYDLDFTEDDDYITISIVENSIVEDIYINGNIRIDDDEILKILNSKVNFYLNKNTLSEDISNIKIYLNSMGYIDNSVKVKKEKYSDNRINLILEVSEGPRYKITDVKFFGNSSFSDKYLYSKINTKTLSSYNIFKSGSNFVRELFDYDLETLDSFYQQKGFFDVKIKYVLKRKRSADFQLVYYVDEGQRYLIDDITYNYSSFMESDYDLERLNSKFEKIINKNDGYFDYMYVKDYIDSINKVLKSQGLFDIEATHTFEKIDQKNILNFYEIKLDKTFIKQIDIIGNSITKDKTLRSKIEVEPGDLYSEYRVKKDTDAIKQLKYIDDVKVETITPTNNDKMNLTFIVNEKQKTGSFMVGGSYSGDVGVGLALNLRDSNFQGSGDEVEFKFSGNTEKILYSLFYNTYDKINSYQTNSYSISNEETDLSGSFGYKTKSQSIGYARSLRVDENIYTSLGIKYSQVEGYDPVLNVDFINDNIDSYNQTELIFNLNFDNTDDIFFPTSGVKNTMSLTLSPESLSKDAYYKIFLQYDKYKGIKESDRYLFFVNDLGMAGSINGNLKTINSFSLGGSNFKGFDYRGIGPTRNGAYLGGNNYFTSTLGYGGSFLFDEKDNINLRLFHTIGSIWGSDYTSDNKFKLRSSAGISFDFLSQVGPISLSYAIPIEKNTNDVLREFNFTLGTSF
tara:strand:- start:353 stop:2602 length:2250 start_codon:yes stop_codon:yes gene_type:complete